MSALGIVAVVLAGVGLLLLALAVYASLAARDADSQLVPAEERARLRQERNAVVSAAVFVNLLATGFAILAVVL